MGNRPLIGAIVLGHARPWLFAWIAEQYKELGGVVDITLDRPTLDVQYAADAAQELFPETVRVFNLSFPIGGRENSFLRARNEQLEHMRERDPVFVAMHDDDSVWIDLAEIRGALQGTGGTPLTRGPDLVYGSKRFCWDDPYHLNPRVFQARNVVAFRLLPGDRWPEGTNKIVHAPERVHDDPESTIHELKNGLLDIGYMRRADRERVFKFYAKMGKVDCSTTCLVTPQQVEYCTEWPALQQRMAQLIPA